jgi:endonuclease III
MPIGATLRKRCLHDRRPPRTPYDTRMPRESRAARRARAERLLAGLRAAYPDARTELDYASPFQLLIATLLSAQATDVSVNAATPALFARYPDAPTLAAADVADVEAAIRTIGLYRTKARNAVATARLLCERYDGVVPNDVDALITLPGVGRKTANVVVSNAFGIPAIAVDTHVGRLARRMHLSGHTDPDRVERDLCEAFPRDAWVFLHHALILHGRRICSARAPACARCSVAADCPSRGAA